MSCTILSAPLKMSICVVVALVFFQIHELIEPSYENDEETTKEYGKSSSPQSSEDESDVESLHSFHYSPKAVDLPSAIRLAKRLYGLDGFKKSDVSRHLSKKYVTGTIAEPEVWKHISSVSGFLSLRLV